MLMTKRKPATPGEILVEEFMQPIGLTLGALGKAMGVQRKHVNELCNDRRKVTAATALILARVFGNSADFWLNVQRRSDLWEAMQTPARTQTDRTREASDGCGLSSPLRRIARRQRVSKSAHAGAESVARPAARGRSGLTSLGPPLSLIFLRFSPTMVAKENPP
jgi:addiction module HigA family antidote